MKTPLNTVVLPKSEANNEQLNRALKFQFAYSVIGLVVGIIPLILGGLLFVMGVGGNTNWTMKIMEVESNLTDAGPGAILFIIGFLIVFISRFNIKYS